MGGINEESFDEGKVNGGPLSPCSKDPKRKGIELFYEMCFHFQNVKGFVIDVFNFSEKHNCKQRRVFGEGKVNRYLSVAERATF